MSTVDWRKSSYSWSSGDCIEVAGNPSGVVNVRDSKDPNGGVLAFRPVQWDAFLGSVRNPGRSAQ